MKFFLNLLFFLMAVGGTARPQSLIKTVQCYPLGRPFDEPVIELGTGQQLFFCFDDLGSENNSYTYKILHCDPDWNNSNLNPFNYLSGFFSNPLDNYEYSFNTIVPYTHYTLTFPNEQTGIKISGNYLLQVFNDANPDSAVISQRFAVVESRVNITAAVVNSSDLQSLYTSQQLNFSVNYNNLSIYNPIRDVRVYVTQNQDPNTRRDFKPTFVRPAQLVYGDGQNNIFNGLSPFRNFQCSSTVYYTQYVKDVLKGPDGRYNFILQPGTVPQRYVPLPDRDGNYCIEAENVQNSSLEADYIIAHFAILYDEPIPGADVYVYGKFSEWQLTPAHKMSYDLKNKAYVGQAELKQGYYDYMYAVVPAANLGPDLVTLQNNFYQTPNEYNIRFYVYDYNQMCFRLYGYKKITADL